MNCFHQKAMARGKRPLRSLIILSAFDDYRRPSKDIFKHVASQEPNPYVLPANSTSIGYIKYWVNLGGADNRPAPYGFGLSGFIFVPDALSRGRMIEILQKWTAVRLR